MDQAYENEVNTPDSADALSPTFESTTATLANYNSYRDSNTPRNEKEALLE